MNIIETFKRHSQHLKIDKKLKQAVHDYERRFVNKNAMHSEFFSGNILGVHQVRFTPQDNDDWFDEVLDIDDIELTNSLHALSSVDEKFNVASDVFYISCIALVHLTSVSALSLEQKHQMMVDVLLIMQYKMLTSKVAHDFRYTADREVMEAVKEAMSKKYHIKKYGSWYGLLLNRAEDILLSSGIHAKAIKDGKPDEKILYIVTDAKTRINSLVKNHWDLLNEIKSNDSKIKDSKVFIQTPEGNTELGDLTRELSLYRTYIHTVIGMSDSFIKNDIAYGVIEKALHTINMNMFIDLLKKFSVVYNERQAVKDAVDDIMTHAFQYIYHNLHLGGSNVDLVFVVSKLRGIYMSSRGSDPILLKIRDFVEDLINELIPNRSSAAVSSARTGLMLYIVIRALARKHYLG